MPVVRRESSDGRSRVIAHIDMDCFYVQVEQRKQPELRGVPTAVVQYNSWKGGGLIAVGYEARSYGVKRSMRGDEAKQACPQIHLVQVPVARGKADLNVYRNAGSEVVSILSRAGRCERASIDEVYLDLTDAAEAMLTENPPESLEAIDEEVLKSHIVGLNEDGSVVQENVKAWICKTDADHREKLLACGALIVAQLRMQVLKETEFTCSAGIAHNKMLAKLASGMNKPAQQTVVPLSSVNALLGPLSIKKMKQLGGKLGSSLQSELGVSTVGDLLQFSEEKLQERCGINTGTWLWNIARGISGEEVEGRLLPKSHGSGKTFAGPQALRTLATVQHWLNELCEELNERLQSDLDQNKRIAHTLTLHVRAYKRGESDSHKNFPSKSCSLRYGTAKIQQDALNLFQAGLREYLGSFRVKTQGNERDGWGITSLSVSASKIIAIPTRTCSIMKYFHGQDPPSKQSLERSPDTELLPPLESENQCELNSTMSHTDFPGEGSRITINHALSSLDRQEQERENQGTYSNMKLCDDHDPACSSMKQTQNCVIKDKLSLSLNGSHSRNEMCLELNRDEAKNELHREEAADKHPMTILEQKERSGKILKHKGSCSILRLFQNHKSCSQEKQEILQTIKGTSSPSFSGSMSASDNLSRKEINSGPRIINSPNLSSQAEPRRETWSYKIDEIDPSVIDELPQDIQEEVRAWLRPHKRPNIPKRGSSIAHYFSPARNS